MRAVITTPTFHVYDDVLPPTDFAAVWEFMQLEEYAPVDSQQWVKVWSLTDGRPLAGPGVYSQRTKRASEGDRCYPTRRGIDKLIEAVLQHCAEFAEVVGERNRQWTFLTAKAFLYPRGTALSWHADSSGYTGAYTFYTHPEWKSSWGGELMIADASTLGRDLGTKVLSTVATEGDRVVGVRRMEVPAALDHSAADAVLSERGLGHYIQAKPNRLVVFRGGIPHRIARVDPAAGEHVRCAIAGFFQPE
ncbi:MAG TPA: 2OG-Fe(II) oxygenase [Thermoanaerobaculia bacterium]|jgi:hypothetical protein|nr:2OG-Fe(II) oxygenase [Thermoanaerobaculia bacterium]